MAVYWLWVEVGWSGGEYAFCNEAQLCYQHVLVACVCGDCDGGFGGSSAGRFDVSTNDAEKIYIYGGVRSFD